MLSFMTRCHLVLLCILSVCASAQDKPTDMMYYTASLGVTVSPEKDNRDVYYGTYPAAFGFFRFSSFDFINDKPLKKFSVRDIISVGAGAGAGKGSQNGYVHLQFDVGLKMRYEINDKVDAGLQVTYLLAADHIAYTGFLPQAFVLLNNVYVEAGAGAHKGSSTDKQRKYVVTNAKYLLNASDPRTWFVNLNFRVIQGRNNQVGNPWESCTQFILGIGREL